MDSRQEHIMTQYLITCRSLTSAQKTAQLLERNGISAVVIKAPQGLSSAGCGYAVSVYKNISYAPSLLRSARLMQGKVFERQANGVYTEALI